MYPVALEPGLSLSHLVTTNFTTTLASLRYAAIQLCTSCAVVILQPRSQAFPVENGKLGGGAGNEASVLVLCVCVLCPVAVKTVFWTHLFEKLGPNCITDNQLASLWVPWLVLITQQVCYWCFVVLFTIVLLGLDLIHQIRRERRIHKTAQKVQTHTPPWYS